MAHGSLHEIKVFVSSPADLSEERRAVHRVIERLNGLSSVRSSWLFRAYAYEREVPPAGGTSPQGSVDAYMMPAEECDILVCAFGTRMGTAFTDPETGESFPSGTAYEFERAYRRNREDGHPVILLYRSTAPADPTMIDLEQLAQVNAFFARFRGDGAERLGMIASVASVAEFEERLVKDLDKVLDRHFRASAAVRPDDDNEAAPVTAPALPNDFVHRPEIADELLAALLRPPGVADGTVAPTVALEGGGGIGKTSLATWVCQHPRIRSGFPDGILWVRFGTEVTDSDLVSSCRDLTLLYAPSCSRFDSADIAGTHLGQVIARRRVLLVLDDVWDARHLDVFLHGAPNCVRLVTTRRHSVLPRSATSLPVDSMTDDQTCRMLTAGLTEEDAAQPGVRGLLPFTYGLPLVSSQINGFLRGERRRGRDLAGAIRDVADELRRKGLGALDLAVESERDRVLSASVDVGLRALTRQAHGETLTSRFLDLAVFREDGLIPLSVLARWWRLSPFELRALAGTFADFSLVIYDAGASTLRLHDVIRGFVRDRVGTEALVDRHASLVRSWLPADRPDARSQLPPDEEYAWWGLAYHLIEAGRPDDLVSALRDIDFVAGLAFHVGPSAVLDAYAMVASTDASLGAAAERFTQSAHLLTDLTDATSVAATLRPRIQPDQGWSAGATHLRPTHPLPDLPHPAFLGVLLNSDVATSALTWSPDGDVMVTAIGGAVLWVRVDDGAVLRSSLVEEVDIVDTEWAMAGGWLAVCIVGRQPSSVPSVHFLAGDEYAEVFSTEHPGYSRMSWSPDGSRAALSGDTVAVVDVAEKGVIERLEGNRATWVGNDVLVIAGGGTIRALRLPEFEVLATGEVAEDIEGLDWSRSAASVLPWGGQSGVEVRSEADLQVQSRLDVSQVSDAVVSPTAALAAACDAYGRLTLWQLPAGTPVSSVDTHWDSALFWSPAGAEIASFGDMGVRLWDVDRLLDAGWESGPPAAATSVSWNPSGDTLVSCHPGVIKVWSRDSTERAAIQADTNLVEWAPDGRRFVTVGTEETILFDAHGVPVARHRWSAGTCTFHWADGSAACWVATWDEEGGVVRALRADAGLEVTFPVGPEDGEIDHARWSDDGTLSVLTRRDGSSRVLAWATPDGMAEPRRIDIPDDCYGVVSLGDGDRVACGFERRVVVRDWPTWSEVASREFDRPIVQIMPTPDGRRIAVVSDDGTCAVVHTDLTGTARGQAGTHLACWSPDGRWLAAADRNFTIYVFEPATGASLSFAVDDMLLELAWCPAAPILAVAGGGGVYFLEVVEGSATT